MTWIIAAIRLLMPRRERTLYDELERLRKFHY